MTTKEILLQYFDEKMLTLFEGGGAYKYDRWVMSTGAFYNNTTIKQRDDIFKALRANHLHFYEKGRTIYFDVNPSRY
nr:MAG TPA: hypothetical protein [Caudoviricetes sp.]